jgi:hypothetical protein
VRARARVCVCVCVYECVCSLTQLTLTLIHPLHSLSLCVCGVVCVWCVYCVILRVPQLHFLEEMLDGLDAHKESNIVGRACALVCCAWPPNTLCPAVCVYICIYLQCGAGSCSSDVPVRGTKEAPSRAHDIHVFYLVFWVVFLWYVGHVCIQRMWCVALVPLTRTC